MNIEEAVKIIKCIPAIYRHRGYYDKNGKWFEGEGNLLTEKEITALETVLSELDNKDKIINKMAEHLIALPIYDENIEEVERILCSKEDAIDYFTKKVEGK